MFDMDLLIFLCIENVCMYKKGKEMKKKEYLYAIVFYITFF